MSKARMRALLKAAGIVVGSSCVLIVAVVLLLRSTFVLNKILPPVQNVLERDFHLKTKISQISIDPFARVALQGVEAQWDEPKIGRVEVRVESLLVRFSVWQLLKRRLQVSSIEVGKPKLKAMLNLPEKSDETAPENPLPMLRKIITNPPVALNLDSLSIKELELDVSLKQGKTALRFFVEPVNLESELSVVPKGIAAALKMSLGNGKLLAAKKGVIRFNATNLGKQLPMIVVESPSSVEFSTQIGLSFADEKKPQLTLGNFQLNFEGEKVQLQTRLDKAGQLKLEVGKAILSSGNEIESVLALAPLFELENANGTDFSRMAADKIFQGFVGFSAVLRNRFDFDQLKVAARLPADGIDAEVSLNAGLPLVFLMGEDGIKVRSEVGPVNAKMNEIRLQGKTFSGLNKAVNLKQLNGTRFESPLSIGLSKLNFSALSNSLEGVRLDTLMLEPKILLGSSSADLVRATINAAQKKSGELQLTASALLSPREQLLKIIPQIKILPDSLGWPDVKSQIDIKLKTPWRDLQKLISDKNKDAKSLDINYAAEITQVTQPPKNSPVGLFIPGGLQIRGDVNVNQPFEFKNAQISTQVDWAQKPLISNNLKIENLNSKLVAKGETKVDALLRLSKLNPLADSIGMIGGSKIDLLWNVQLQHGAKSILNAALPPVNMLNADFGMDASVKFFEKPVKPLFEQNFLLIEGPLSASVSGALRKGNVKVGIKYSIPRAGSAKLAVVEKIDGVLKLDAQTDLKTGISCQIETRLKDVLPAKSMEIPEDILPYLKQVAASLKLHTDLKSRVDLEQVNVNTANGLLTASLRGGTDLKVSNSRFDGQLSIKPPSVFRYGIRAQDKVVLDGFVRVGWELTQKEQKSLRLRGNVNLDNFTAQHQLGGLRKASGRIPFQQDLDLPNFKSLRWSYLIRDNPFKRVDTSKFVPLTLDDSLLTIVELNALEKKFGPLRARVSLQQNMLTIDKLDAEIFDGVLAGQGFVDIQPSRLLAGLQGRVTKLNTALLSSKPEKMPPAPLSARLALIVDLAKALVEGRVDVTEIGRNQLLALMDVLDPSGSDSLLNKARLALAIGYPRYVGMQMQQGFLDLDIGLGGVLEQQFKISNLPLTPIINAKTQDLVKTMREVPIQ